MSRYENPQRKNKIDIPSFKDIQAQLDCKLTYGNKNQTQPTLLLFATMACANLVFLPPKNLSQMRHFN